MLATEWLMLWDAIEEDEDEVVRVETEEQCQETGGKERPEALWQKDRQNAQAPRVVVDDGIDGQRVTLGMQEVILKELEVAQAPRLVVNEEHEARVFEIGEIGVDQQIGEIGDRIRTDVQQIGEIGRENPNFGFGNRCEIGRETPNFGFGNRREIGVDEPRFRDSEIRGKNANLIGKLAILDVGLVTKLTVKVFDQALEGGGAKNINCQELAPEDLPAFYVYWGERKKQMWEVT